MPIKETDLPIETALPAVKTALHTGAAVLTAEAGAGKSTIVPLRLLDEPWRRGKKIVMLEPRRVAARAVATRMASLLGEDAGQRVGYRTRTDRAVSKNTQIEVVTEGILTRRIQSDPSLNDTALLIFDEFHERNLHADIALAFALETREVLREDLRILVMSATIDAPRIAGLLETSEIPAPIIACEGRTHPIKVQWRPPKVQHQRNRYQSYRNKPRVEDSILSILDEALQNTGDILVFLPGVGEIKRTRKKIEEHKQRHNLDINVYPLHGSLSTREQEEALTFNQTHRRILLATDIAETSLTVEGVGVVIDSGLTRKPTYDAATDMTRLVTVNISKASAEQRSGRAGRLGPGVAYRLWSKKDHAIRPRHAPAEITQVDATQIVLEATAWGTKLQDMKLLDTPNEKAIKQGEDALRLLDLVQKTKKGNQLTAEGKQALRLPLHPRLAHMVHTFANRPGSSLGWAALMVAALLSERDVFRGSDRPTDLWARVQLLQGMQHDQQDVAAIKNVEHQIKDLARRTGIEQSEIHPQNIGIVLAHAYPDRIAQNRGNKKGNSTGRFLLRNGIGAQLTGALASESMVVAAEITGKKQNPQIRKAAAIDPMEVELIFTEEFTERTFLGWDKGANDLAQRVERRLGQLDFGTHPVRIQPSEAVQEILIEQIKKTDLEILTWSQTAKQFQARVTLLRNHGNQQFAAIDTETLHQSVVEFFAPYVTTATCRQDLEEIDLYALLRNLFPWDQQQQIDTLAPPKLALPTGKLFTIDYLSDTPSITLRAQELYGLKETPRICNLPVTFTLLSPAQRPIQTTADLENFWNGSWQEVRKDMQSRYPKHSWPQDPNK